MTSETPNEASTESTASSGDPLALRARFFRIGLAAVVISCALFAVFRAYQQWHDGLLTPWWGNALGLALALMLQAWYARAPAQRLDVAVHLLAAIATIALLVPVAYGMYSTLWWLTLVGFSMNLMSNQRDAVVWTLIVLGLILAASIFGADLQVVGASGESAGETLLSRLVFAVILFGIAFGFAKEIQRTARELIRSGERLQRSNRAKDRFLAQMSHELRTPLHGVIAMTDHALRLGLDPEQTRRIQSAHSSAEVLLRLLDDVIDVSRAQSDALVLDRGIFSLHARLAELLLPISLQAADQGLAFEARAEPGMPQWRLGDATRVGQIVLNLIGNALKFTDRGSVSLRLEPWPAHADGICLRVRDTGIGISQADVHRLARPFVRIDNSTTRMRSGAGLGLSIVRELAQRMQGELQIESEPGVGSTFSVCLRLAFTEDASPGPVDLLAAAPERRIAGAPRRAAHSLSMLVCEDNAVNRLILHESLQLLGHRVVAAQHGREAWQYIGKQSFDVVFTDIEMPEMDGYELLRRMREAARDGTRPAARVVAVTAHARDGDRDRFLGMGFDHFLQKPFTLDRVSDVLEALLPGSGAPERTVPPPA